MHRLAILVLLMSASAVADPPPAPRAGHASVTLADGRVMVSGGYDTTELALATVEIFDPATKQWAALPALAETRKDHTATLLADGRVLVVGGLTLDPATTNWSMLGATAFDPKAGTWTHVAQMPSPRTEHTATRMTDGRVLITNGLPERFDDLAAPAVYEPRTDRWTATRPLQRPRIGHAAVALANARVAVIGGMSADFKTSVVDGGTLKEQTYDLLDSIEVWDAGSWTAAGQLVENRGSPTATVLPDGRILVVGGESSKRFLASAELCDLTAKRCTKTGALSVARAGHRDVLLATGEVAVIGGDTGALPTPTRVGAIEIWNPKTGTWRKAGTLKHPRREHTASLLPDGSVLVVGGDACGKGCVRSRADPEIVRL
jgi:N-acetylneuraminic acid mutarotase